MPDDVKYCIDLDKKIPFRAVCLPVSAPVLTRTPARAYPYPEAKAGIYPRNCKEKLNDAPW